MEKKALILDLDDTIFSARSMDGKIFEPFFNDFQARLTPVYDKQTIDNILADLWTHPINVIVGKYNIPRGVAVKSIAVLNRLEYKLNISVYPDYHYVKKYPLPKFLVTTGITNLQRAKIEALGIEEDFIKIVINDPMLISKTKKDIFHNLVHEFNLIPERTYVIGDNPDSEIISGNALNMPTIQITRDNLVKSNIAKHYIKSFSELESIID